MKEQFGKHIRALQYMIEPAVPAEASRFDRMHAVSRLRTRMQEWGLEHAGCVPDMTIMPIEGEDGHEGIFLRCAPAFIVALHGAFKDDIATVTRMQTRDTAPSAARAGGVRAGGVRILTGNRMM